MNPIEQHLKENAQAFKIKPPDRIHSEIMKSIKSTGVKKCISDSRRVYWFFSGGLALSALLLGMINLQPSTDINQPNNPDENNTFELQVVNVDDLSLRLESHFITGYKQEQKALKKDLVYMKNLFLL